CGGDAGAARGESGDQGRAAEESGAARENGGVLHGETFREGPGWDDDPVGSWRHAMSRDRGHPARPVQSAGTVRFLDADGRYSSVAFRRGDSSPPSGPSALAALEPSHAGRTACASPSTSISRFGNDRSKLAGRAARRAASSQWEIAPSPRFSASVSAGASERRAGIGVLPSAGLGARG